MFFHCDAIFHRADDLTQVTAYAFALVDLGNIDPEQVRLAGMNALMRAVVARDLAQMTTDALRRVDLGDGLVVHVEITPL